jgi:hypothetical protein
MDRWFKIIVGALVVGLLAGITLRLISGKEQREANSAAAVYADRMQGVLATDPRFRNVIVYQFSGFGCAKYKGNVAAADDLAVLRRLIDQSSPPKGVTVLCVVTVGPPDPAATQGLR